MNSKIRLALALSAVLVASLLACSNEIAPCVPVAETCNNIDDDCDGVTDNNLTDVTGAVCGDDTGECQTGTEACQDGVVVCQGSVGPRDETCNNLDDDCDNATDEELTACACTSGSPSSETCNAIDDDCNEQIDDGFGVGLACDGDDSDECQNGTATCRADGSDVECVNENPVDLTEICNNVDDDCDGETDEGFAVGVACDGDDSDYCANGISTCSGDNLTVECINEDPTDLVEICNNIDDDCDGDTDQGMSDCGCTGGNPPTDEVCNNIDDNCNQQVDEGLSACGCTGGNPPVAEVCNNSDDNCNTEIDEGLPACQCSGGNAPGTEVCDGVDNDCNEQIDEDNGSGGGCAEFGDPCNSFNDCISQVCVGDQFERYCTQECDPLADPSTWPAGYRCYIGPNLDYYLRDYTDCSNNADCAPDDVCTVQDADDQLSVVTECRPPLDSGGDPGDDCESGLCANGICSWRADLCSEVCSLLADCEDLYLGHDTACILSGFWVTPGDCGRDEQCPGGYVCTDSVCLGPVCSDDGECETGYSCRPPAVTPPDNICQPLPFWDYVGTCAIACDGDPDCPAGLLCFPGVAVDSSAIQGFCEDPSSGAVTNTGAGPCGAGYDNCSHAICYGSGASSYCTQLCGDAGDCPGGMNCTAGTLNMGSLGSFPDTYTCTNP